MRRVLVIGTGGSGKTTLSVKISTATGLPVVHLDSLYWSPGWVPSPAAEWQEVVAGLVQQPEWILDGNYGGTIELRLAAADTVIFLDPPRTACLWRLLKRQVTYHRQSRPSLPADCADRLTPSFLWWVWTYRSRRRPQILERLEQFSSTGDAFILRSNEDVSRFLDRLTATAGRTPQLFSLGCGSGKLS